MISFSVLTLGCKVNSYESEAIINDLINHGWELKDFEDQCDVYIVNTCTVTQTSDQKSRQMLHQARRNNPNAVIVAVGCYVQLNPDSALDNADIVIGTNEKLSIYRLVNEYLQTRTPISYITDVLDKPKYEEMCVTTLKTHTRGFIKIQDGCENYCSYCAIPYARGKIRSRNPELLINEINNLVSNGTKEVILAGINTGTYGADLSNINLAKLIERIMEETNLFRLRLSSIELKEISDELLQVLKKYSNRIAHHLHIPLQAGSNSVLKRMNRRYSTEEYQKTIDKIREIYPDCALTTDILAGFVGETDEEYNEALDFISTISFYEMHVFPYSRRKGTVADQLPGHLNPKTIKEHAKGISNLANINRDKYIKEFIGKEVSIILETSKNGMVHGHSSNYLDVYFENINNYEIGSVVNLLIEKYDGKIIYGKEITHE